MVSEINKIEFTITSTEFAVATPMHSVAAGVEVHAVPLGEVGENGSGGVTCLTRPVFRA